MFRVWGAVVMVIATSSTVKTVRKTFQAAKMDKVHLCGNSTVRFRGRAPQSQFFDPLGAGRESKVPVVQCERTVADDRSYGEHGQVRCEQGR